MSQVTESIKEQALRVHKSLNDLPISPLSERETVRRGLFLANDVRREQMIEAEFFSIFAGSHGLPAGELESLAKQAAEQDGLTRTELWWRKIRHEREAFREDLDLIQKNRKTARRKLRAKIEESIAQTVCVPNLTWTGQELVIELRYLPNGIEAICGYIVALLLDEKRGMGDALRICKLDKCDAYFLSLPAAQGGRPPLYCSREHQAIKSALSSAERTAEWRKRKARKGK